MPAPNLFRVILPVSDIEAAARFYTEVLDIEGARVSPGRHYFDCGGTILALFDPRADGDHWDAHPNSDHIYFSMPNLAAALERVRAAGPLKLDTAGEEPGIARRPWGETSFYFQDPFGNRVCFVESGTEFRG